MPRISISDELLSDLRARSRRQGRSEEEVIRNALAVVDAAPEQIAEVLGLSPMTRTRGMTSEVVTATLARIRNIDGLLESAELALIQLKGDLVEIAGRVSSEPKPNLDEMADSQLVGFIRRRLDILRPEIDGALQAERDAMVTGSARSVWEWLRSPAISVEDASL